jgi:DNA-binding NarL/FixJ family response regulator
MMDYKRDYIIEYITKEYEKDPKDIRNFVFIVFDDILDILYQHELTSKQSQILKQYMNGDTETAIANHIQTSQPSVSRQLNKLKHKINLIFMCVDKSIQIILKLIIKYNSIDSLKGNIKYDDI